jgi:hypothetical protein
MRYTSGNIWQRFLKYIFYDSENDNDKRVGIGTNQPDGKIHIVVGAGLPNTFNEAVFNGVGGAAIAFRKARGTINSKTTPILNDISGGLVSQSWTGLTYNTGSAIRFFMDENQGATNNGMRIVFQTKPNASGISGGPTDRLTIKNDGIIIIHSIPTSSTGLPTGALWNDGGFVKIV